MSNMISLRPVKQTVIIVLLVPIACRVLGMTFVSDRAHRFEDGQEYWNQDWLPVARPSKGSLRLV
jgi:hypothetical protein